MRGLISSMSQAAAWKLSARWALLVATTTAASFSENQSWGSPQSTPRQARGLRLRVGNDSQARPRGMSRSAILIQPTRQVMQQGA